MRPDRRRDGAGWAAGGGTAAPVVGAPRSHPVASAGATSPPQVRPRPHRRHRYVTVRSDHGFDQRTAATALS